MLKRPLGNNTDSKITQADIPADTQKEDTDQFIEMAAEQLAILLWRTWLHTKNAQKTKNKKRNVH